MEFIIGNWYSIHCLNEQSTMPVKIKEVVYRPNGEPLVLITDSGLIYRWDIITALIPREP